MERFCKSDMCTGCGACAAVCPVCCIRMEADQEGFLRPVVQEETCIGCGLCRQACPVLTQPAPASDSTVAYAAIHTDPQVRYSSTSGGIFSLICDWVFARGGIVYGAAYDSDFNVVHCCADSPDALQKFRGAKYAQSNLGETYRQVQDSLMGGQYVLFSGTPCQVGGLVSFLGKDHDKLILVDLICHGVPSPDVWQHYIRYRSRTDADGAKPIAINMRSKETGWPGYSIRFDYPDGKFYSALNSQDPYLRGFVGDLYLRPSCYDCRFKGIQRQSDFTLGDYWGVWNQLPTFHDEKGTSLILLHTSKARTIWKQLMPQMQASVVDVESALADNPSARISSTRKATRDAFFARYAEEDFPRLIDELLPKPQITFRRSSLLRRIAGKIQRILRKS